METIKDRLIQFIKYKGLKVYSFEKQCGLATSYVANMRTSIQPDKMMSIANNFPDLNFDWLMLGRGSMIYQETAKEDEISNLAINSLRNHITDLQSERDRLIDEREEMKAEIDRLRRSLGMEPMKKETA